MQLLGVYEFANVQGNRMHTMSCSGPLQGGFSKIPDAHPDVLHSYFGLAGLSLSGLNGLLEVDPSLAMTKKSLSVVRLDVYYV